MFDKNQGLSTHAVSNVNSQLRQLRANEELRFYMPVWHRLVLWSAFPLPFFLLYLCYLDPTHNAKGLGLAFVSFVCWPIVFWIYRNTVMTINIDTKGLNIKTLTLESRRIRWNETTLLEKWPTKSYASLKTRYSTIRIYNSCVDFENLLAVLSEGVLKSRSGQDVCVYASNNAVYTADKSDSKASLSVKDSNLYELSGGAKANKLIALVIALFIAIFVPIFLFKISTDVSIPLAILLAAVMFRLEPFFQLALSFFLVPSSVEIVEGLGLRVVKFGKKVFIPFADIISFEPCSSFACKGLFHKRDGLMLKTKKGNYLLEPSMNRFIELQSRMAKLLIERRR